MAPPHRTAAVVPSVVVNNCVYFEKFSLENYEINYETNKEGDGTSRVFFIINQASLREQAS